MAVVTLTLDPHFHWFVLASNEKVCCILLREDARKFTYDFAILWGGRIRVHRFATILARKNGGTRHTVKGTI